MSTEAQTTTAASQPLKKFSRYRSVRKANSERPAIAHPPLPGTLSTQHGGAQPSTSIPLQAGDEQELSETITSPRRMAEHEASLAALEGREYRPKEVNSHRSRRRASVKEILSDRPLAYVQPADRQTSHGADSRNDAGHRPHRSASTRRSEDKHNRRRSESRMRPITPSTEQLALAPTSVQPTSKEPFMTGALPADPIDVPISAVNTKDRKVTILWDEDVLELSVTPDTTARQLVAAASARLGRPNSDEVVLLESFSQLGLERPIRRYEHIRDIMNSWDRDDLNALIIRTQFTEAAPKGLSASEAPPVQPEGRSFKMYHSQHPGKWDKRIVTLRSDGQVSIAKKEGAEGVNICHLSDSEMYNPTKRQLANRLKPPRKYCVAIKSQEKSAVFLDGSNYVHFFSSHDQELANSWYDAVQSWRSWYLLDVLGLSHRTQRSNTMRRRSISDGHGLAPLIDRINHSSPTLSRANTTKQSPGTLKKMPPSAFPVGLNLSSPHISSSETYQLPPEPNAFAPSNLPGRSMTTRRPGTSDGGYDTELKPTLSARPSSSRDRNSPHKPLVDLTPAFQEPPQHARKGHAVAVEPGTYLIDNVTNPDGLTTSIALPDRTALRRPEHTTHHNPPPTTAPLLPQPQRQRRRSSTTHRPSHDQSHTLLTANAAKFSNSQGISTTGRGVTSYDPSTTTIGNRARSKTQSQPQTRRHRRHSSGGSNSHDWNTPLLDLRMQSQFKDGSLLRKVEMETDGAGPHASHPSSRTVINREVDGWVEGVVGVGEAT